MNRLLLFLLLGVVCGCSSSVQIDYYRVDPVFAVEAVDKPLAIDVAVENFQSSPPLRRNEIVFSEKGHRLELSSTSLWWALPEEMVAEAFLVCLSQSKVCRHVVRFPTTQPVSHTLEGYITRFEIFADDGNWGIEVALQLRLFDRENNSIVWDSGILQRKLPTEPNLEAAVAKIDEALQSIFAAAVEDLAAAAGDAHDDRQQQ